MPKKPWTEGQYEQARELRERGLTWLDVGRKMGEPESTARERVLSRWPELCSVQLSKPRAKVPIFGNVPPARVSDAYGRLLLEVGNGEVVWHRELFRGDAV